MSLTKRNELLQKCDLFGVLNGKSAEYANINGEFVYPNPNKPADPFTAPSTGTILTLSVITISGCSGRIHEASFTITKVLRQGETADTIAVSLSIPDCATKPTIVDVDYKVHYGRQYSISGVVEGFDPNESVSGTACIGYSVIP